MKVMIFFRMDGSLFVCGSLKFPSRKYQHRASAPPPSTGLISGFPPHSAKVNLINTVIVLDTYHTIYIYSQGLFWVVGKGLSYGINTFDVLFPL